MGWVRDASKCSSAYDGSVQTARDGYIVPNGVDPGSVSLRPTAFLGGDDGNTPLPGYGSPHPSNPLCRLDSYSADTDGSVAMVIANYSTDGRFTLPFVPQSTGYRWRADTENYVFSLPFAARTTDSVADPDQYDPNTQQPVIVRRYRWVYQTQNFAVKAQRIGMSLKIPDDKIIEAMNTCYEYQNMAMPINGRVWVFEGGSVDDSGSSDDYRLQLNFVREKDVRVDYEALPPMMWWPEVRGKYRGFEGELAAKPAYHKTVFVMPEDGDVSIAPGFASIPCYEFSPDGFEALRRLVP